MRQNKKKAVIVVLCTMLFFMGVGYAILSETIKVVGINKVAGKWDVHIESINETNKGGSADSQSVKLSNDKLSASFVVDLFDNDDFVEYTVVVKNNGNIPAKLKSVDTSVSNASNFITFNHDAVLNQVINPSATQTFTVRVAVNNPYGLELTDSVGTIYKLTLNYVQG